MSFFNNDQRKSTRPAFKKKTILVDTESNDLIVATDNVSRKKVGKAFDSSFSLDVLPSASKRSISKSNSSLKPKNKQGLYRLGLVTFIFILVLRGIFMDGGLIDYNQAVDFRNSMISKKVEFKNENTIIDQEISQLEKNKSYLKKIVREQLGVISPDEYILVFSE